MAQGSVALRPFGQQVAYLRKTLPTGAAAIGTNSLGWIPGGSAITAIHAATPTIYNGTPTMTIGSRAAPTNLVAAAAALLTTLGAPTSAHTVANSRLAVDTEIVAVVGGTPTVGSADIIVSFIPPNEAVT